MSEQAADLVAAEAAHGLRTVHVTADHALNGNTRAAIDALFGEVPTLAGRYSLEREDIKLAIQTYGVLAPAMLECVPDLAEAEGSRFEAGRFDLRHPPRNGDVAARPVFYRCPGVDTAFRIWSSRLCHQF